MFKYLESKFKSVVKAVKRYSLQIYKSVKDYIKSISHFELARCVSMLIALLVFVGTPYKKSAIALFGVFYYFSFVVGFFIGYFTPPTFGGIVDEVFAVAS